MAVVTIYLESEGYRTRKSKEVVEQVVSLYLHGYGYGAIARKLNYQLDIGTIRKILKINENVLTSYQKEHGEGCKTE